jgi:hypothetical protein
LDVFGKKIAANPTAIVTSAARDAIQRNIRSRGCSTNRVTGEMSKASMVRKKRNANTKNAFLRYDHLDRNCNILLSRMSRTLYAVMIARNTTIPTPTSTVTDPEHLSGRIVWKLFPQYRGNKANHD